MAKLHNIAMQQSSSAQNLKSLHHKPIKSLSLLGKCALLALIALIICAIVLPFFAPYAPYAMDLDAILAPASSAHILGTDHLGRDIYTRLIYGAQVSLLCVVAILALVLFYSLPLSVNDDLHFVCIHH